MSSQRPTMYYLKNQQPVAASDYRDPSLLAWHAQKDYPGNPDSRVVGRFEYRGVTVSTVFLTLDHQMGDGPPILFETMIFAPAYPQLDECMWRYDSREHALKGHELVTSQVEKYLLHLDGGEDPPCINSGMDLWDQSRHEPVGHGRGQ